MNNLVISNIIRFIFLLAAQILVFNNIDLFGFINPFPYILFILLYPSTGSKPALYLSSFFLGLTIDMFEYSGGTHAAASLMLALSRPYLLKFSFGVSYQYHNLNIMEKTTKDVFKGLEVLTYLGLGVIIHHCVLFTLEILRFNFIWQILLRTLLTTIFTLIVSIIIIYLIKKPSKK